MVMNRVTHAIDLRNEIIHGSEIDVPNEKAAKVIEDVGTYMEFILRKFKDLNDHSN
jgi:hypothetical protein